MPFSKKHYVAADILFDLVDSTFSWSSTPQGNGYWDLCTDVLVPDEGEAEEATLYLTELYASGPISTSVEGIFFWEDEHCKTESSWWLNFMNPEDISVLPPAVFEGLRINLDVLYGCLEGSVYEILNNVHFFTLLNRFVVAFDAHCQGLPVSDAHLFGGATLLEPAVEKTVKEKRKVTYVKRS
jgi:hypothetical protein